VAVADKRGAEGVAQDVAAEAGVEAGLGGDGQQDVVGGAGRQAAAAAVSSNAGLVSAPGPAGAFIADPQGERLAQPGVHGDLAVAAALPARTVIRPLRAGICTSARSRATVSPRRSPA